MKPDAPISSIIETIYARARAAKATIILAEADDPRVKEAAQNIDKIGLARTVLLDISAFTKLSKSESDTLVATLRTVRTKDNLTEEAAREMLAKDTKFLAATMVRAGMADGYVSGNVCPTADTIRPALKIIGTSNGYASSFFIMLAPGKEPLFYADAGFNVDPNAEQLAQIGIDTSRNVAALGVEPRVAFVSFSTAGSAEHPRVAKVCEAIRIAREKAPDVAICPHELQFDAAVNPDIAARKVPNDESGVAGRANVIIFPDLDSGNIAYKIDQERGGAQAIGPLFQGFNAAVNDLSRGCKVQDIVDVVAFSAMQAGEIKGASRQ